MPRAFASPASPIAARGRWIPWVFFGGMLTVFLVNAVLVYFAMSSWSGIATDRAFERGLAYNRLLAAAAAEEALGWQATVDYRAGNLVVVLHGKDGQPIDGAAVTAEAQRPLESRASVSSALEAVGSGRYVAKLETLRAGQWDIRLNVVRDGAAAHLSRRVVVR